MANGHAEEDRPFPKWFIRLVIGFCLGALGSVASAIWWASDLSANMGYIQKSLNSTLDRQAADLERLQRQHDKEVEELEVKLADLELRHQYLDKRVEVIKDRTGMRDLP